MNLSSVAHLQRNRPARAEKRTRVGEHRPENLETQQIVETLNEKEERYAMRNIATLNKSKEAEKKTKNRNSKMPIFECLKIPFHTNRYHEPWLLNTAKNGSAFNIEPMLVCANFVLGEDESILIIICPQDSRKIKEEEKKKKRHKVNTEMTLATQRNDLPELPCPFLCSRLG